MTEDVTDDFRDDLPDAQDDAVNDAPEASEPIAPKWSQEDEDEARVFGWKPPTEWKGDLPAGYIDDPATYLEKRVRKMRTFQVMEDRMEAQRRDFEAEMRRVAAVSERVMQMQREQYERKLGDIQAQQRQAIRAQDEASYDALEKQKFDLIRQASAPVAPQVQPDAARTVEEFRKANQWTQNPLIWDEARRSVDMALEGGQRFGSPAEQLEYASSVIKQKYPHLFQAEQPQAQQPAQQTRPARMTVDPGGIARKSSGGFNTLPAEARAAFARFAADGIFTNDDAGRRAYYEDYTNG